MAERHSKYWRRLDNAALIFPASRRKGWYNRHRLSVTLTEDVDPAILQSALDVTAKRFPLIAARLRRGVFWYYLEEVDKAPAVLQDGCQPLMVRPFDDVRSCGIRVLYYKNRFAVEFFHAITDGGGGTFFVKTLLAEYLEQAYGISVPCERGVLDRNQDPQPEELEDSFLANKGDIGLDRKEGQAYHIKGEREADGFLHLTCGTVDAADVVTRAKALGVSVTAYLSAVLVETIIEIQAKHTKPTRKRMLKRLPVRVQIPIDHRRLFPSKTLRNFVMVTNIGVDPRLGTYTFEEIAHIMAHQLALQVTEKNVRAAFTTNVNNSIAPAIKPVPLFLKNIIMRIVFDSIGESQATLCLSNMGVVDIPDACKPYVQYFDFIIGPQAASPHNVAVCTYGSTMRINFVRNSVDPEVERSFYTNLVRKGIHVLIASNDPSREA